MNLLYGIFILAMAGLLSCRKKPVGSNVVFAPTPAPYSQPLWHPSGTLLGYNYRSDKHPDSTGYYVLKADGSGKTRALNFPINTAQWSRDGKWLAYSFGDDLYKVYFNGITFDLTQIVQLTHSGRNYFPSWNESGDSLAYDSNVDSPDDGYRLWRMAADGSGKAPLVPGRMPLWVGKSILYLGRDSAGIGVFKLQWGNITPTEVVSQPNGNHNISTLRTYGTELFYQLGGMGIYKVPLNGGTAALVFSDQLAELGYDISPQGKIAYVWYSGKVTATEGVIWIRNVDGSGKKQLTYNSF